MLFRSRYILFAVLPTCSPDKGTCDTAYLPLPEGPASLSRALGRGDTDVGWPLPEDLRVVVGGGLLTVSYTDADGRAVEVVYRMEADE